MPVDRWLPARDCQLKMHSRNRKVETAASSPRLVAKPFDRVCACVCISSRRKSFTTLSWRLRKPSGTGCCTDSEEKEREKLLRFAIFFFHSFLPPPRTILRPNVRSFLLLFPPFPSPPNYTTGVGFFIIYRDAKSLDAMLSIIIFLLFERRRR